MIDVYIKWGDADYLDLSGKRVLPADKRVANLQSFVIGYKAWNLMGDYSYNPSFYYELNRTSLIGKGQAVYYDKISKYPDLARRYQAMRPSSVNLILTADLVMKDGAAKTVNFKISHNDLNYFESRSAKNLQFPVSPSNGKWKSVFSTAAITGSIFTDQDASDEKELRLLLKNFSDIRPCSVGCNGAVKVTLDIRWNDDAIDEIGRLYEKYEKENKKIDDELKAVKEADKLVNPVTAYDKNDEMSAPFEEEAKSAEIFKEDEIVGLRAKGKVVFQSAEYYNAEPLNSEKSLFKLNSRKGGWHLYNAKGKRLSVDGKDDFLVIREGKRPGTYYLYVRLEKNFFTTKQLYPKEPGLLTQSEFDRFVAQDERPQKAPSDYKEGTVYMTMDTRIDFSRGTLYTVDDKLQVISKETGYY